MLSSLIYTLQRMGSKLRSQVKEARTSCLFHILRTILGCIAGRCLPYSVYVRYVLGVYSIYVRYRFGMCLLHVRYTFGMYMLGSSVGSAGVLLGERRQKCDLFD